jgi:hypothetical protein
MSAAQARSRPVLLSQFLPAGGLFFRTENSENDAACNTVQLFLAFRRTHQINPFQMEYAAWIPRPRLRKSGFSPKKR